MTEQLGKHNASGPLARRPDGTVDPAGYVKSRMSDRRNLAFHALLLIGWGVAFGSRCNSVQAVVFVVVGFFAFELVLLFGWRAIAGRREQRRRTSGLPPSWPAGLLAVLQAREAGFAIPRDIRNDSGMPGRLVHTDSGWTWTARPSKKRPDPPVIELPVGWSPQLHDKLGLRHVLTFCNERGDRIDFGIGARQDLARHLRRQG